MNLRFSVFARPQLLRSLGLLAGLGLAAGCRHESVAPVPVVDYFPVAIGTYRTYAVTDSVWVNARPSVTSYQLRERVAERFTDAAGQTAYRLVRSKRASAGAAWADDSVLVVVPLPRAVLLTRNNLRTVELIYPAQAGKGWNANAFTASPDTITSISRVYGPGVAGPYTTPAAGGQPAKTYANTVLTKATPGTGTEFINLFYQQGQRQVYASGVGLVLRRRFSFNTFTVNPNTLESVATPNIQAGAARLEVLIDTGTI